MDTVMAYEVFSEQYASIYQDLYKFALYSLQNVQDAEDVVSETVADAFAGFHNLRSLDNFRGWMFRILSNKCKGKLKEYIHKTAELPGELPVPDTDAEGAADVRRVFARLGEEERLLISLKVFGGYNSREIGRMLHMNENTVRSRISRGLGKMRSQLEA